MSRIIFLHGASSAGKSTLAAAIRSASPDPWLHLSLDHVRDSGAVQPAHFAAENRARTFDGLHRAFAGFADAGCDLIVEHILDAPGWHTELQRLFAAHQVLFVGIHTPLDTLNAREVARADRPMGSAAQDFASVHAGLTYDLTLDGTRDPAQNAQAVLAALGHSRRSAFFD